MNIVYFFGALGGCFWFLKVMIEIALGLIKFGQKYKVMKLCYERHQRISDSIKMPLGFHTEKERDEIESRLKKNGRVA